MKIFEAVASSVGNGIADDALKDADNGIWLLSLPLSTQEVWQRRFYCIRWIDRLAEQDLVVQPGGAQFPAFYRAWQTLLRHPSSPAPLDRWPVLQVLTADWSQWKTSNAEYVAEVSAWNEYIEAIATYHHADLTINTLQEYEVMLDRLAGSCFQLLPNLDIPQRQLARKLGYIDQFYNNLRDLYEDTSQGLCYFPTEVLNCFGLTRQSIIDCTCLNQPGYQSLMQFWVEDYLAHWRQQTLETIRVDDFQDDWQQLMKWFLHRYRRIEMTLQDCQYDFVAFAQRYWSLVAQELATEQKMRAIESSGKLT
ncbi:MAG: squalene/phytoene synthase family protein [Leptolyngbyaceae cyanobacterium]